MSGRLSYRAGRTRQARQAEQSLSRLPFVAAVVWAEKIRGKLHYFGPWNEPYAALKSYLAQRNDLHAERIPRPEPDALTVKEMINRLLNAEKALVDFEKVI